jgi:hypothetical protein
MLTDARHAELQKAARLAALRVARGEELVEGAKQLKRLVGADNVGKLVDRLRIGNGQVCFLLVHEVFPLQGCGEDMPWCDPNATNVFEVCYGLSEGVKILQGPDNPEVVLARRRKLIDEHERELADRRAQSIADTKAEQERTHRELVEWRGGQWRQLNPILQIMLALGFELEVTRPEIAAALFAIARRVDGCGIDLPRRAWWRELGRD